MSGFCELLNLPRLGNFNRCKGFVAPSNGMIAILGTTEIQLQVHYSGVLTIAHFIQPHFCLLLHQTYSLSEIENRFRSVLFGLSAFPHFPFRLFK